MTSIRPTYTPATPADLPGRTVFADTGKLSWPSGEQPALKALAELAQRELQDQVGRLRPFSNRLPPPPKPHPNPGTLAEELARRSGTVRGNHFQTHRGLHEYLRNCGPLLAPALARIIVGGGAWLDVGSGHVAAMADFRKLAPSAGRLVAVNAGPFERVHGSKAAFAPPAGVLCMANRRIETIFPTEVGRFDVVTDVVGAMSYCDQPDIVLRRMLELARVGGLVFFSTRYGATSFVRDGATLRWEEWLRPVAGARLLESGLCDEYGITHWFVLEKTSPAVGVQRLAHESFVSGTPPIRRYRLLNPS